MKTLLKKFPINDKLGTNIGYIILGYAFGIWAMLIPFLKDRLNVDKATLGGLLLFIACGAVFSMFLTGFTVAKFGCKKIITLCACILILCLFMLSFVSNIFFVIISMFFFGISLGMLDVTLNIQGAIVEEKAKKHLMSGFHGMYCFGVFFGIIAISYLLKFFPMSISIFINIIIIILLLVISIPAHLNYGGEAPQKLFIKPTRILFILGLICFIAFIAEGMILDWSVLFMREARNIEPQYAGYSFSFFYVTMGVFRLMGNKIASKLPIRIILFFSSLCATFGILIMVYIPFSWASFLGFALAGVGLANMVPITMSAAAIYRGNMPIGIAVSSVATVGYFATLFGPSVIGIVSEITSLSIAFSLVAFLVLFIAFLSRGFSKG